MSAGKNETFSSTVFFGISFWADSLYKAFPVTRYSTETLRACAILKATSAGGIEARTLTTYNVYKIIYNVVCSCLLNLYYK